MTNECLLLINFLTHDLTAIGLMVDIVGVVILFKYGPLQPSSELRPGILLEDNNLLEDGRTVKEHEVDNRAKLKCHTQRSHKALWIILIGFCLQLAGTWL